MRQLFKIVRNTYPVYNNVPHANINDICFWRVGEMSMELIRVNDNKIIYSSPMINKITNKIYSTNKDVILEGVIAQVKSKDWYLELKQYNNV